MSWIDQADRLWATELGLDIRPSMMSGVQLRERADGADGPALIVGTSAGTVISFPPDGRRRFIAAGLALEALRDAPRAYLASAARPAAFDVRGPAYLGYLPPAPAPVTGGTTSIVELEAGDLVGLGKLRDTAPDEWDEGGVTPASRVFGAMVAGELVAVGAYERWEPAVAQLQVFCAPRHRRAGLAQQVLEAAIAAARAEGRLPQYRARDTNTSSRALAARLGFVEYGWMATVRLP